MCKFNYIGMILLAMWSYILPHSGSEAASPTIEWKQDGGITYSPSYIISHRAAADKARGLESGLVRVKMTAGDNCPPLDYWAWYISNNMMAGGSEVFAEPKPRSVSREKNICTFGVGNGSREVKAKVWDTNEVEAHIVDNVPVDNAYLYSIAGSAHNDRTLTIKYYTINNGWAVLPFHQHMCGLPEENTFDAWTYGGSPPGREHNAGHTPPADCPNPDPMTEAHQYCVSGNTPPYGKNNPADERTYREILDTDHYQGEPNRFGLHQIYFDDDITVTCGCSRGTGSNILIHGPYPKRTWGCISMYNSDLEVLTGFFENKHDGLGADFHISVTAAPPM